MTGSCAEVLEKLQEIDAAKFDTLAENATFKNHLKKKCTANRL